MWRTPRTGRGPGEPTPPCLSDGQLELYSMGRMAEPASAVVEEHLLLCSDCQDRLNEVDEYVALMKQETGRLVTQPARPRRSLIPQLWISKPVWAGAFALLIATIGISWQLAMRPAALPVETVQLVANRGVHAETHAVRNRRLTLKMDLTELPAADAYRVQVVDSTGAPVWQGTAKPGERRLQVSLNRKLEPGTYWVRLYGGDEEFLREYGLRVD